jgi:NAD(P)-dependent dehydrogenase (short-subunit alcohol dehydrogenase family)
MTRIAIREMLRAKKPGVILHIASVAAETVNLITPLYHASKHGIGSFVMGMGSLEAFCGIRVVGVAPGYVQYSEPFLFPNDSHAPPRTILYW